MGLTNTSDSKINILNEKDDNYELDYTKGAIKFDEEDKQKNKKSKKLKRVQVIPSIKN